MLRLAQPSFGAAEIEAVAAVLRTGRLVHGAEGEAFERELGERLDGHDVVVVSSGTAALHLALWALGLGPGDAVVVPDFTFPATANAVAALGARPLLVDVEPDTFNLAPERVRQAIDAFRGPERVRALMPVHQFGAPADPAAFASLAQERGLWLVEDAACALGARSDGRPVGTFGAAGCFSFHPRKPLTTGEGGAIAVSDATLARRLRRLRNHGRGDSGFESVGLNLRLTEFQSALGRVQLPRLEAERALRSALAERYVQLLAALPVRLPAPVPGHVWQTYVVVLPERAERDGAIAALGRAGVEAGPGAACLHELPAARHWNAWRAEDNPESSRLGRAGLALPLHAQMEPGDVDRVVAALAEFLAGCA